MQVKGLTTYSFPMKPSVFYGLKEIKVSNSALPRPLTIVLEFIMKECKGKANLRKRPSKVPSFFIKTLKVGGVFDVVLKSVEKIIRNLIYSLPAGEEIDNCKKDIADVASMFKAVPISEGDMVARIPVIFAEEVRFLTPEENLTRIKSGIFSMKPYNFGFLVIERAAFEELIEEMERKIKAGFS